MNRVVLAAALILTWVAVLSCGSASHSPTTDGGTTPAADASTPTSDAATSASGDASQPGSTDASVATDGGSPGADAGSTTSLPTLGTVTSVAEVSPAEKRGPLAVDPEGDVYNGYFFLRRFAKGATTATGSGNGIPGSGIADLGVNSLAVDPQGNVWTSLTSRGMFMLPAGSEGNWTNENLNLTTQRTNYTGIATAADGSVYVGQQDYGVNTNKLFKLAKGATSWTEVVATGLPSGATDYLAFIGVTADGTAWVSMYSGVFHLAPGASAWVRDGFTATRGFTRDAAGNLWSVQEVSTDSKWHIWKHTGVTRTDMPTAGLPPYDSNFTLTTISLDAAGSAVLGGSKNGALLLYKLASGATTWTELGGPGAAGVATPLFSTIDGNGNVWISAPEGVYRTSP